LGAVENHTAIGALKVLHVQKVRGIGGSENHLLTLLPALRDAEVDARMLVAGAAQWKRFAEPLRALGVPTRVVSAGPDLNPRFVVALLREIRSFRPDVLHTHLVHADLHGQMAAGVAGVRRVSSVHGTPGFYRREPYRSAARFAGRFSRATIAISDHVRAFLEELRLARAHRIQVVPYGIDAAAWAMPEPERARARSALDVAEADIAVGIAARLIPGKGHSVLLEAFGAALRRAPRLRLLIAGDGPLKAPLERDATRFERGTVRLLGYRHDMRAFMNACDVLAFPTEPALGEGFGLAALEAMACGRPVVATRVGSLPEVVADRESGFVVSPGAVDELASALVQLAQDQRLRRDLGARAAQRAQAAFSVETMVARTLDVYDEALRA
jgi:glycosyltransferase involved in cell wall biosynthesis